MSNSLKIVFLVVTMLALSASDLFSAGNNNSEKIKSPQFNWDPVIEAIIYVESRGDHKATNGNQVGAMQITPILVAECNEILRKRNSKKRFKLSDRFSLAKSKEMFLLIQSFHNPMNDVEKAIRSWNGGMNYSVRSTQKYFEKVMRQLRRKA